MSEQDFETAAETEEREATEAGMVVNETLESFIEADEYEAEKSREASRCCSDPLCPCPKF